MLSHRFSKMSAHMARCRDITLSIRLILERSLSESVAVRTNLANWHGEDSKLCFVL